MSCTLKAALGRVLLLLAIVASAIVAACGGGSGGGAAPDNPGTPGTPGSSVSGTAATGAPLPNVLVTLKDSTNRSVTATTAVSGDFKLDSTDLTPPFLLQVSLPSGTRLFSVSTDANRTATINVTPLTDVLVRTWFGVQGKSAETAFANPATTPAPLPSQVRSLAVTFVHNLQLAISANGAPITDPLDLIAKPFTANGTGIDKLLDNTKVTVRGNGADLVLTAGSATQSTTLSFNTATSSITASSTTTRGTVTTTVQSIEVVPVQDAQLTAIAQIAAGLNAAAAVINAKGANLAVADLEPFFDANLLHRGQTRAETLADTVLDLRQGGRTIAMAIDRVRSLDLAAGKAELVLRFSQTVNGATAVERETNFFMRGADGQWRFGGDGRIASVELQAEGRTNQGLFTGDNGPSVNADVRAPQGRVTNVTISSVLPTVTMQRGSTEVLPSGHQLDVFFANTGALTGPLPAAGLPVTFTLDQAAGGSTSYTLPLNAFTTELIRITSPTATTVGAGTLTVTWTLPTTYVVERTQLAAMVFTGDQTQGTGFQCIEETIVSPTATSGVVTIPATCNGQPVLQVNLNVSTNGTNGERSMVVYNLNLQ